MLPYMEISEQSKNITLIQPLNQDMQTFDIEAINKRNR